jgi:hypothetical protein
MRITSRKVTQAANRAAHYTALLKSRDFGLVLNVLVLKN